jgi:hypothetical protein
MDTNNTLQKDVDKTPESKTRPQDGLPPVVEKIKDAQKKETEEEVKESFKDTDVPVELPFGNDGLEVGGEG